MTIEEMLDVQNNVMDLIKYCASLQETNAILQNKILNLEMRNKISDYTIRCYEQGYNQTEVQIRVEAAFGKEIKK